MRDMEKKYSTSELAKLLYGKGFEPIPIAPRQKYPTLKGWPDADCGELVENWPKDNGIGLRTGRVSAIDIDVYCPDIVQFILDSLEIPHITRIGQPPKVLVPLLCPEIKNKLLSDAYVDGDGVINRIEVLSYGQQFVAYGIHPDTKKPYQWSGDLLAHSLPVVEKEFILHMFDLFYELACKRGWKNLAVQETRAKKAVKSRRKQTSGDKPGDFYNRAVSVETVLSHYGWKHVKGEHWRRPGKKDGISGHIHEEIFCCFTSSTVLPGTDGLSPSTHDAFDLMAYFEFGGDKIRAAQELRKLEEVA